LAEWIFRLEVVLVEDFIRNGFVVERKEKLDGMKFEM